MENVTFGRMLLFMAAAAIGAGVLSVLLEEAGRDVALGVAIAAIVALLLSYLSLPLAILRSTGDEEASKRVMRRRVRVHLPLMLGAPLIVLAAHPWGMASIAVAAGLIAAGQLIFIHTMLAATFILKRRERRTQPPERPKDPPMDASGI